MSRTTSALLVLPTLVLALLVGTTGPAAAVTAADKVAKLTEFTHSGVGGFNAWNAARQDQAAWREYGFDWSTDYCSQSPDNPLGFDFSLACWRHDWGYRNFKDVGLFAENKSRVDSAFHADLKRRCATYNQWIRPACTSLAWVYYQAVVAFGATAVRPADIEFARQLKEQGEANADRYRN